MWWIILRRLGVILPKESPSFSICITTFLLRYENLFRPALSKLALLFPDQEIIVLANGHHDTEAQRAYLKSLRAFLEAYPNVRLLDFMEPRGLSYLWNLGIRESTNEGVFVLNDDIDLSPLLRKEWSNSELLKTNLATNGNSWSQFYIRKSIFEEIGPFDEGLREIGGEDDDYLVRMKLVGKAPTPWPFRHIWTSRGKAVRINSYGKDMRAQKGGYSTYNSDYLDAKWIRSKEPVDGAVLVRGLYWKKRERASSGAK